MLSLCVLFPSVSLCVLLCQFLFQCPRPHSRLLIAKSRFDFSLSAFSKIMESPRASAAFGTLPTAALRIPHSALIQFCTPHLYHLSPLCHVPGEHNRHETSKCSANVRRLWHLECAGCQAEVSAVPQEHLKIARSFNCGSSDRKRKVPSGRPKFSKNATMPSPTCNLESRARHSRARSSFGWQRIGAHGVGAPYPCPRQIPDHREFNYPCHPFISVRRRDDEVSKLKTAVPNRFQAPAGHQLWALDPADFETPKMPPARPDKLG